MPIDTALHFPFERRHTLQNVPTVVVSCWQLLTPQNLHAPRVLNAPQILKVSTDHILGNYLITPPIYAYRAHHASQQEVLKPCFGTVKFR
jgi:hypothetical protein